ncbi:MAG: tRNA 2-selenouridine(34) synthase MnmH [Planctomycetota bacterium]
MATPTTRSQVALLAITPAELFAHDDAVVIDLRSPAEHAEDHVPGAKNLPLFNDDQRALVGTLYVRESPSAAFERARHIVRERIHVLVQRIADVAAWTMPAEDLEARVLAMTSDGLEQFQARLATAHGSVRVERPVVFHCWRGGLRSQSVATLVQSLGLDRTCVLAGGYKAYRTEIVRELDTLELPQPLVLRGLTGVGKTLVLGEIDRLRPNWTLDLEDCAQHRSSLLGMVGRQPCSQRMFETRIAARLRVRANGQPLVVEGESRKVGDATVPRRVWSALQGGTSIELTASVERRVRVLAQDYLGEPGNRDELLRQLPRIEARMPKRAQGTSLAGMLERGETGALIELLLEHYYDPLYRHSQSGCRYALSVDATDPARAAAEIVAYVERG